MLNFIRNTAIAVMAIMMSVGLANAVPAANMRSCPSPTCIIGAILIELDKPMGSGRTYSTAEIQKVVTAWRGKKIRGRLVVDDYLSESGKVSWTEPPISESSHIASNLRISGELLVCDIEILPSPTGGVLTELVRLGLADFRAYGVGSSDSAGYVSDFKLIRVDVFPTMN
jgi:hypothetical protein